MSKEQIPTTLIKLGATENVAYSKEEHIPMIFTPLPKDYRPKTPPPSQVSFDLKRPPLKKGEVPDSYYEADRKMRLHFLGDENAIQGDSSLHEEFAHTSQANSMQTKCMPVFFSGNSTRQDTLTATKEYDKAQEKEKRTTDDDDVDDADAKSLEEVYEHALVSVEQHNPTPDLLGQITLEVANNLFHSKL